MKKKIKRSITLLEIMIVVLLIGIIGTVLGFNMKGSLDEGKAFKTREGAKQVRDILIMQVEDEENLKDVIQNIESIKTQLKKSGLVSDVKKLVVDGWGNPYTYKIDSDGDLIVSSEKLKAYEKKKAKL